MTWKTILVLLLLAVLCFPVCLAGRHRAGRKVLLLLLVGISLVVGIYFLRSRTDVVSSQARGVTIEVVDDLDAWKKTGALGFKRQPRPISWDEGSFWVSDCSWVDDAAGSRRATNAVADTTFIYWELNEREQVVGYSRPEATEAAARSDALRSVQEKIAVLALIKAKTERPSIDAEAALPLAHRLARLGERDSELDDNYVYQKADLIVEESTRDYGKVYRAAVLVQTSNERIDTLKAGALLEIQRGWAERQARVRLLVVGTAGLLILGFCLFLVYAFLNAGTKGYFAWPLRVVSGATFIALVVVAYYVYSSLEKG